MNSQPHLRRILTRTDLVIYGLVLLGPTAPYPVYGLVQQKTLGHAALAYLAAMVGVLFTALSYAKMSSAYPAAGSTYTYTRRALNEHAGFLAGWSMMLDYFLIPLVSIIFGALTAHRLIPGIPYAAWALGFTAALTAINIFGIRVTARASEIMMAIMSIFAVVFIVLCARYVVTQHGIAGLFDSRALYRPQSFHMSALMLGAGIAALSYIGFDAISTLAEDTVNPMRDIGFATVLVCILQTAICFITVYLAALVWPDYASYPEAETVILDISTRIGGPVLFGFLSFVILVAALASALTGQAGASRLLYGMGRDGALPPRIFAYLHPRFATPTRSIYLMGALCAFAAVAMRFEIAAELLNFGAFAGFVLVNLSVIRHFYVRQRERSGLAFVTNLLFPALGALVCLYLWASLSRNAKIAGFLWLLVGAIYLAIVTRGFRLAPKSLGSLSESSS
ncbi:MAG TPA: APC family permease [Bryobacteraceae bacterium]|jgi:amino acid transporter|nr:APC family permease [Bryobacteraceae bacterium]